MEGGSPVFCSILHALSDTFSRFLYTARAPCCLVCAPSPGTHALAGNERRWPMSGMVPGVRRVWRQVYMPTKPACLIHALATQMADVWSCGVMLYVMLVGAYPFERTEDKNDNQKLQKMIQVGMACFLPCMRRLCYAPIWRLLPCRCSATSSCLWTLPCLPMDTLHFRLVAFNP